MYQAESNPSEIGSTRANPDDRSLVELNHPSRPTNDRRTLEQLAELNGLNKEEVLRRATFSTSGHVIALDLSKTDTRNISPLAEMATLTELNLRFTHVRDVSPLAGCTALTKLDLCHTDVRDISPLAKLKLTELDLSFTDVRDISPLAEMTTLTDLGLACTKVTRDPSPLAKLTALSPVNRHELDLHFWDPGPPI